MGGALANVLARMEADTPPDGPAPSPRPPLAPRLASLEPTDAHGQARDLNWGVSTPAQVGQGELAGAVHLHIETGALDGLQGPARKDPVQENRGFRQ